MVVLFSNEREGDSYIIQHQGFLGLLNERRPRLTASVLGSDPARPDQSMRKDLEG